MHHLFSNTTPQSGSSRPLPKTDSEIITKLLPDEKSHGLGSYTTRTRQNKWPIIHLFSDFFGLRSPVIQKKIHTKSATSIVARVIFFWQIPGIIPVQVVLYKKMSFRIRFLQRMFYHPVFASIDHAVSNTKITDYSPYPAITYHGLPTHNLYFVSIESQPCVVSCYNMSPIVLSRRRERNTNIPQVGQIVI